MSISEKQKQTNINIQEKANLIWNIATHIVGLYKPHEYGKVILPFTVLKRFDDALKDTKAKVVEQNKKLVEQHVEGDLKYGVLKTTAKHDFYNVSPFDFEKLAADPDNIESNFDEYLNGYSDNVKDIIANFKFTDEIKKLADGNKLYIVLSEFASKKADMSPDKFTSTDMGYIFEELIRKFSESYDEQAGAHFTARDIIYLMTELLIAPERDEIAANGCTKLAYDMAMGTSQMLGCLDEKLKEVNENSDLTCYGQENNPETYAIAKADMLIKGGNASGMKYGDTLDNDQFTNYEFDYIISNPPFGIDWKSEESAVKKEHSELLYDGRFGPGLPPVSDGQLLFLLNGLKKLKTTGRMAIIQGSSSLDNGEPESGISNIRKYLLESDYVETIIKLPNDLFYNTPISTCIWVICKEKHDSRINKVQLIDAQQCYIKRRKNIGDKKVDLDESCIDLILKAYADFDNKEYNEGTLFVESKIFDNADFQYYKAKIESPVLNPDGTVALKKGKPIADSSKNDTEIIYAKSEEDCQKFFDENVKVFLPNSWINFKKTKVGYGIPFTKLFYHEIEMIKFDNDFNYLTKLISDNKKNLDNLINLSPVSRTDQLKESKVSWIGNIPDYWQVDKVKYHFYKQKEVVGDKVDSFDRLALTMKGVIKRSKDDTDGLQPTDFEGYQILREDDLVFKMIDLQNISTSRVGLSPYDGIVSPAYIRLTASDGVPKYAYYYFMSMYYNNIFNKSGSDGVRSSISADDMLNFALPVPPRDEQIEISEYLDGKTKEIDELINKQEEIIEELKRYKKALVYEVVSGKRKPKKETD